MTPEERKEFVKDRHFGHHHPFERGCDDRFKPWEPEKKD
jgi:hypothetical protein